VSLTSDLEAHGDGAVAEVQAEGATKVTGRSPTQLAIARFRGDKLSMISLLVSVLILLCAIAAPILVGLDVLNPYKFNQDLMGDTGVNPDGRFGGVSWDHPFGVEPSTGRDVMSRLMLAMTWSLGIALTAALLTMVIGIVFGIVSGFSGGLVDATVGRFIDLTLSFPQTMMLLALSAPFVALLRDKLVSDRDLANGLYVILILAAFGWPPVARVIRGQVLSIREREYIEAARLMGASRMRLYFKEVLPNVWAPILVFFTLLVPAYISAEAAFSFLGVGIKPPTPTLGNILAYSVSFTTADPTFFFLPGVLLALTVVAFNLVGDGARDALDPKTHR
jgi:peptide/nickel transport system permease protein